MSEPTDHLAKAKNTVGHNNFSTQIAQTHALIAIAEVITEAFRQKPPVPNPPVPNSHFYKAPGLVADGIISG